MDYRDETGVVNGCKPLIAQARAENKLLWEQTNMLYVSPDALERLQRDDRFCWSAENWTLISRTGPEFEQGSGYL